MAKSFEFVVVVATALCFVSLIGFAHCHDDNQLGDVFYVAGSVYCDTCRVQFETKLTTYIPGAKIRLECRTREGEEVKYTQETVTDEIGRYLLLVEGEHEEDICEVKLVESPSSDCNEIVGMNRARVLVSKNNGVITSTRYANSLGFLKKEALPECAHVFQELGFVPLIF